MAMGLRRLKTVAAIATAMGMTTWVGCAEEEPPPPNDPPVIQDAQFECVAADNMDIDTEVLSGGTLVVVDEMIATGVTVEVGGLETVALTTETTFPVEGEEPEGFDPLLTPQTWTFEFDPARRVLCNESLVLTFTATDDIGQTDTQTRVGQ